MPKICYKIRQKLAKTGGYRSDCSENAKFIYPGDHGSDASVEIFELEGFRSEALSVPRRSDKL